MKNVFMLKKSMKSKLSMLSALCFLAVSLGGCTANKTTEGTPAPTLAPASVDFTAPESDRLTGEEQIGTLYLPAKNGLHLVSQHVVLPPASRQETLLMLTRDLLQFESNDQVDAIGRGVPLSLFGEDPVELSGGVCTVNLGSSALQLSHKDFYLMSVALSSTLCELDEVNGVNVLVAGQSVGLDISGGLAMGTLSAHPGDNLPILWERMESKKTPLGSDLSLMPLSTTVTMYYPLANGHGVVCEERSVTFDGQTPQQMAQRILEVLAGGSMFLSWTAEIPDLNDLFLHEPVISELDDGGRLITLSMRENGTELLAERNVDAACFMASLTLSLTTFIPGTAAICVRIGEQPMTRLDSALYGEIPTLGGLLYRKQFADFLMGRTTVYYAREGMLVPCEKNIDRRNTDSPRAQLVALMEEPEAADKEDGIEATLPSGIHEEDILGIAYEGDTLLVNLSDNFLREIRDNGPEKEQLLCYSMVNTLCMNRGTNQICFFFDGEQVETIAGEIYWAGTFDRNDGLIEPSFG